MESVTKGEIRLRIQKTVTLILVVCALLIGTFFSHMKYKQQTFWLEAQAEGPRINESLLSAKGTASGEDTSIVLQKTTLKADKSRPILIPNHVLNGSQSLNALTNAIDKKQEDVFLSREYHSKDYLKSSKSRKTTGTTVSPVTKPIEEPIQCSLLISGDIQEIDRTKKKLSAELYTPADDSEFINVHEDCVKFINSNGYFMQPQSKEEEEFPLAFTIRMHANVAMAEMLLRNIYHPQNVYCIHIDKKSSQIVHQAMKSIAKCLPNVFLTERNVNYTYGGFSAVEADLVCMQELLNTGVRWKYLLNMAGSEFPLKTNLELVRVLKLLNGTNEIEQFHWAPRYSFRINSSAIIDSDINYVRPSGVPKAPFRTNITLMKGCSYNTFSRAFVEWVLSDSLAQEFITWTRDTISPDETVWGTLNYLPQAPGGYQVEVTETAKTFLSREIIWSWSSAYCWEQHFVRGVCILSSRDLGWLSQRWEFIANKFDLSRDHYVVECLQEAIRNRTEHPDPDNYIKWDVIKQFPHIQLGVSRSAGLN